MRKKEMAKLLQESIDNFNELKSMYEHYQRMANCRYKVVSPSGVLQDCSLQDLYIARHRNGPGSAPSKEFWITGPIRIEITSA
jgi:hypothetical protein